jgi:hypothetical protein
MKAALQAPLYRGLLVKGSTESSGSALSWNSGVLLRVPIQLPCPIECQSQSDVLPVPQTVPPHHPQCLGSKVGLLGYAECQG